MKLKTIALPIAFLSLTFLFSCSLDKEKRKPGVEVNSVAEFIDALTSGKKVIYVSDLDLDNRVITINHDLEIISLNSQAIIKNAYFKIVAPVTAGEAINVSFSGLTFDGGYDLTSVDLSKETSFIDIFESEREDYRFINTNEGYFSININDCEIKNYVSEVGSVLYLENNNNKDDIRKVTISNSKIYNNCSIYDIIHMSHVKLETNINNCEFYNNYAYKCAGFSIANGTCVIDKVNVHDNIFTPFDIDTGNFQLCGGGIFLGGSDIKMTNSYITNNKTTYGGGLGVATPYYGNKSVVFKNVTIANNEATYGGGICAYSLIGQPISFIDCEIISNTAKNGGALFSEVYAKFVKDNDGGLIEFLFSTFALNSAEDNNSYNFYNKETTKGNLGKISLYGSISIGKDVYKSNPDDYNYIATKEQALLDGVIDDEIVNDTSNFHILPKSKADAKVSEETYSSWSNALSEYHGIRKIGKNKANNNSSFRISRLLIIAIPSVILMAILILLIVLLIKRKQHYAFANNNQSPPVSSNDLDTRKQCLILLNEREQKIVKMLFENKKRKEIAKELNYSENTIKKDLTSIYTKLNVQDKYELMMKYKELI